MPDYRTHLIGGFATFLLLMLAPALYAGITYHIPLNRLLLYMGCALAGALFPDIDIKSRGQRLFARLAFPVLGLLILFEQWTALSVGALMVLVPLISAHRGITHRVWFILVVPFLIPITVAFVSPRYVTTAFAAYLFFAAGALSHVALDYMPMRWRRRIKMKRRREWRRRR